MLQLAAATKGQCLRHPQHPIRRSETRLRNGFRKNKPTEKNPESEENLFEHLTDGKDVFNMINISCENFPLHDFRPISVGGVR